MVSSGNQYDDEFKADAMRLVKESSWLVASVANNLRINL